METTHFNDGMAVRHFLGLCLHLLLFSLVYGSGTSIGVSYDSRDNTLPSPKKLVKSLKEHDIFQVILLDANPIVLKSLAGTGIQVTVGMSSKEIEDIGNSKFRAALWLKKNVMRFRFDTFITGIDVGHEAMAEEEVTSLVSTMKAIYSALSDVNLDEHIKVTATLSSILLQNASTALASSSTKKLRQFLYPLLDFLSKTGSFLVMNTTIDQNSACNEELIKSIVAAANNVMAFLQYPDIPIAIDFLCPISSGTDTFLITKNLRIQFPIQDKNSTNIFQVLVKMNVLNCSSQIELGGQEQFLSTSRELLGKKANSTRNKTSQINTSLVGETTPTTPITTPITTPTTTPITTPTTTPITTPTTPVTTPITTPITSPTTPTTTPVTTPVTTPTTPTTPTTGSSGSWCIAKPGVSDTSLQVALDYACGLGGADCGPIQPGGTCYNPDTVAAHASYAFDNYYKKNGMTSASCDFGGNAMVTNQDPSSGTCTYSTSGSGSSVLNTSIGNGGLGSIAPANSSDAASILFCLPIFFTLISLLLSIIVGERF